MEMDRIMRSLAVEPWVSNFTCMSLSFLTSKPDEMSIPGSSVSKESSCNAGDLRSIPGWGRSPGEGMATTPVFVPGESQGQKSLEGYGPWGRKSRTHDVATKPPPPHKSGVAINAMFHLKHVARSHAHQGY